MLKRSAQSKEHLWACCAFRGVHVWLSTAILSKFQGFVHGSESRIARLAHQSTGNWIGQLHATRSKPLVRDHSDTTHGIVMPRVAAEHKSEAL